MGVQNPVAPPYPSTASVLITLRDTNDNPPVFSMPRGYSIPVPEEALLQRPIGTVVATDEDGGINGTVSVVFRVGMEQYCKCPMLTIKNWLHYSVLEDNIWNFNFRV